MKRNVVLILILSLMLSLTPPSIALTESPVPDELPDDLGGKTLYGYLMELKSQYAPAKVFQDAAKYSDLDRENARRAARLIVEATTQKMDETGQPDQYFLYLRAYSYELLFQDGKDAEFQVKALADYKKTVELGGGYAQTDYDRVAAMEVQAAPLSWQIPQVLTAEEMGNILGIAGGDLFTLKSAYQRSDGSRLGAGYALRSVQDPAASAIFVLADPLGGKARYDRLKGMAFLGKVEEITGLGDEAAMIGLRNQENNSFLYTTALVLKGEMVLQVRIPDHAWRGPGFNMDPSKLAKEIAAKLIANLYDAQRTMPDMAGATLEDIVLSPQIDPGNADSPVPDEIPADLGGKTVYGYLVELRQQYLPEDAFTNPNYGETDRNNSRRAIRLLTGTISDGFDINGQNPYELEIRAACYAAAFDDTNDPAFRQLAINDYKQAMNLGYPLAKPGFDKLATPLLTPMAELKKGASGGHVAHLQQWLIQAGYLTGKADGSFGGGTEKAVKAYEKDNALTQDGVADIAFLLSLYAKIEDGDALYLD